VVTARISGFDPPWDRAERGEDGLCGTGTFLFVGDGTPVIISRISEPIFPDFRDIISAKGTPFIGSSHAPAHFPCCIRN
jgi:hypothetical protein